LKTDISKATLSPDRWRDVERLYRSAVARPEAERASFLQDACGADAELRREVEALLAKGELAGRVFESPSAGPSEPRMEGAIPAGTEAGSYVIQRLLGRGGMGEVYEARDSRLGRSVALKFLPSRFADDPDALERFEREARAASSLNHPNICTIHDVGRFGDRPFFVMELLEGRSLKDLIGTGALPVDDVIDFGAQIADALAAAHAKGIVHRDIKPANIFVTAHGEAKVLDFGLAKLTAEGATAAKAAAPPLEAGPVRDEMLTTPGTTMGTLAYMSPEQARGEPVDARTDIFSLGVVLYEMATGTRPFRGESAAELLRTIAGGNPSRPTALRAAVPFALERVILDALAKDPARRSPSAAGIQKALLDLKRGRVLKTRRWVIGSLGTAAATLAVGTYFGRRLIWSPGRVVVAVLPLEDLGKDPDQSYFAEGLQDELISVLGRLYPDRLGVIGSSSVRHYKEAAKHIDQIGRELHVAYVVDGSVRREGNRVRISAKLIRVKDQAQIWSETYDRDLVQILAVQSDVAQSVAQGIERTLKPSPQVRLALSRPVNPQAYEAYLRGENEKAISIDPDYAPAHASLAADLYFQGLFGVGEPKELFSRVQRAATRAIELDPTLANGYASLALAKLHIHWNWRGAEADFRHAIRLDPSNSHVRHDYAHFLLCMNRTRDSAEECRIAVEHDPFDSMAIGCFGWHELLAGDFQRAAEESRRALALDASNAWALIVMGWAYEQLGRFPEALSAFKNGKGFSKLRTAALAHVFALSGNRSGAEELLSDLSEKAKSQYVSSYDVAVVHEGLGNADRAFDWLNRAYEEESGFMPYLNVDPRFKSLHADRRFGDLLRRMGLTPSA
jgi:eukaryotic-like serine/threonine-protein kinase